MNSRFLFSEASQPKVVVIRGLPQTWFENDIQSYFDKNSSQIQKINLIKNRIGDNTGKALITFGNSNQAESFIKQWNQSQLNVNNLSQQIAAEIFTPKVREQAPKETSIDNKQIYIYNLPWKWGSEDLKKLAADFGQVSNLDVPLTANNKNKGFAYMTFTEAESAQKFLQFVNDKTFVGRKVKVTFSKAKIENQKQGAFAFGRSQNEQSNYDDNLNENMRFYKRVLNAQEKHIPRSNFAAFYSNIDKSKEFDF